jgi:hypothetical protein
MIKELRRVSAIADRRKNPARLWTLASRATTDIRRRECRMRMRPGEYNNRCVSSVGTDRGSRARLIQIHNARAALSE